MIFLILAIILVPLIPATIASNKGRSAFLFWVYGLALFPIAVIHALLMEPNEEALGKKKCPKCAEIINIEAEVCPKCGAELERKEESPGLNLPN